MKKKYFLQLSTYVWFLIVISATNFVYAVEFDKEYVLYRGEDAVEFSRNPQNSIGVDSGGRIHLAYFIPDQSSSSPDNRIMYLTVENGETSSPVRVDSTAMGGGRHPSLVIDSKDAVHVVWQDYRHTTATGNYIDNIEIYYDSTSIDGRFALEDLRLTDTNASHKGDNGYVPNIAIGNDNRIHVTWYDYTSNGNNADIYLQSSDVNGVFPIQSGIEDFRITNVHENPADYTSNWLPDVCTIPDGSVYVVWGFLTGWQGTFELQGRAVSADGALGDIDVIAPKGSNFSDPPRLAVDKKGNMAIVYSVYTDGMYQVDIQYKPMDGMWSDAVRVNDGTMDSAQPSIAFDSKGDAHLVWQEDFGGIYQVAYARFDPQAMSVDNRAVLSSEYADARTPAIALHPGTDQINVVWIDRWVEGERSIVGRNEIYTAVEYWQLY
jgi:hypothetical protein